MTTLREAAQQALEALEWHYHQGHSNTLGGLRLKIDEKALRNLRAALAQQEEPDAYGYAARLAVAIWEKHYKDTAPQWKPLDYLIGVLTQIDNMTSGLTRQAQQAEPVQEPVAKVELMTTGGNAGLATRIVEIDDHLRERLRPGQLLYTAPPQRKPLTEKEMYIVEEEARKNFRLAQAGPRGQMITYWDSLTPWLIRAVERAHGIKE